MLESIPLSYYAFSGLINFVASFALAILVLYRNPKSAVNRIFSVFAFVSSGWGLSYFLWLTTTHNSNLAEFYLRTLMLFVIFVPATFTHFILSFVKPNFDRRINFVNYLISFLIGSTVYMQLFAKNLSSFLVFPYWLKPGPIFHFHLIHFLGNIIYSHILMLRALRRHSGVFRSQILYIFIGTAIGYSAGVFNYFPWYRLPIPPFLNPLVSIYVAFVSYAIIKYHLMDIDLAWRYGLSYSIYALVSIVLFIPMIILAKHSLSGLILLGFFGFLVAPFIYTKLIKYLQPAILGTKYSYWDNLKDFWDKQREVYTSSQLFDVLGEIPAVMGIKSYSFFMFDRSRNVFVPLAYAGLDGIFDPNQAQALNTIYSDDSLPVYLTKERRIIIRDDLASHIDTARQPLIEQMNSIRAQVSVPLFVTGKLTAILNLGPKQNREMYHEQDMERLREVTRIAEKHLSHISFFESSIFFSGSVAHDIRKPFKQGIIDNLINDIAKEPLNTTQKQALNTLKRLLSNIHDMSEDMVNAFKNLELFLKTGFKPQKIDYIKLINDESRSFEALANQKGIAFERSFPKKEPVIYADPISVQRIINELLTNAFKYTDKGCIKIKVSQQEDNGRKEILTEVSDTGCGIAEETQDEIWELFKRGENTKAKEGEGIGLAMVRQLVEANGGKILLNSSKGNGSNFIFSLPAWEDKRAR